MARKSSKIIPSQCRRDKIITQVLLFDPRQVECCDIGLQVCRKDKKCFDEVGICKIGVQSYQGRGSCSKNGLIFGNPWFKVLFWVVKLDKNVY